MQPTAIFWPMIAHAALVFALYPMVRLMRGRAVRRGEARISDFRDREKPEPPSSRRVHASLANQFELPVLFHAGCLSLFATGGVSTVPLAIAWVFALSRWVHAAIHIGPNRLRYRFSAFVVGLFSCAALWICLALHLLGSA